MSADISSGNIGVDVRNDIQRRNEWQKILAGAEDYFSKHPPYAIVYESVNANDITDNMTVKIVSVNGIDAETIAKTGYINISAGEVRK
jgi:hypothetical protein